MQSHEHITCTVWNRPNFPPAWGIFEFKRGICILILKWKITLNNWGKFQNKIALTIPKTRHIYSLSLILYMAFNDILQKGFILTQQIQPIHKSQLWIIAASGDRVIYSLSLSESLKAVIIHKYYVNVTSKFKYYKIDINLKNIIRWVSSVERGKSLALQSIIEVWLIAHVATPSFFSQDCDVFLYSLSIRLISTQMSVWPLTVRYFQ